MHANIGGENTQDKDGFGDFKSYAMLYVNMSPVISSVHLWSTTYRTSYRRSLSQSCANQTRAPSPPSCYSFFFLSSVRVRESPKRKHSVVSVCPYAPMRIREKGEKEKEEEKAAGLACNLASHKAIAS